MKTETQIANTGALNFSIGDTVVHTPADGSCETTVGEVTDIDGDTCTLRLQDEGGCPLEIDVLVSECESI